MLRGVGYVFDCKPADVPEKAAACESPEAFARRLALSKARTADTGGHVHGGHSAGGGLFVLGADTDVSIDGEILGKPNDREDALAMLARLSGRTHRVCSAVALVRGEVVYEALSVTEVSFGPITPEDAAAYWASGEPADKAGAYAIQGGAARWIREIRGSYTGVVGLPLFETCELLAKAGIKPSPVPRLPAFQCRREAASSAP